MVANILVFLAKNNLSEALCDQIAKLDFMPEAQEITAELCGTKGPFGNAEVLNTNQGSRLFRSLVEVNPQATSEALYRIYYANPVEELKKVVQGRRNLIWALEKLCFWENTFEKSAKVLAYFALAENEPMIANNATSQLIQLFRVIFTRNSSFFGNKKEFY